MLHHIVFWKLKPTANGQTSAVNIAELTNQLNSLKGKVPELISLAVGPDLNRSPAAWDIALYTTFRNKEDLDKYQVHPEHKKVVTFVQSVVAERAVVDFED